MVIKKNLDEIVYDKVVESLINGEFIMGQQILLDELVEKFKVSRTPISQASKLLSIDGILELRPNGRLYVPSYDDDQIRQIVKVRLLIETYALQQTDFVKNQTILDNLKSSATRFLRHSDSDFLAMAKEDLKFHKLLVNGAGNEYLSDVYKRVQGRYIVASYLVLPPDKRDNSKASYEHFNLVELLEKNDITNANKLLEEHINDVCNQMVNR